MFATFLLAIIEVGRHELTIINAGHLLPMIRRAGGAIERIGGGSARLPLGVLSDETYCGETTTIGPGDLVVLYTDGVTEALSPDRRQFGLEGLRKALKGSALGAGAVGEAIRAGVRRHVAGQDPYDDITILCFGRP
jgi:serine phosphatase RsbU (regulator of sigma subunit)